ncbi:MAG: hypothetical protein HJJLKODD_00967 [Phycisphaerae bacterium]|nr:hypothetical protein [Phycisphaerae bacterium]
MWPMLVMGLCVLGNFSSVLWGVTDPPVKLVHTGRYNHQNIGRDHLVGCIAFDGHYGLTCSYDALRVIDLAMLPSGSGSGAFVSELRGHDVYSLVKYNDEYFFANIRLGGLGVVRVDPESKTITWLVTVEEPGVFYEGMKLVDDRLYVAAHRYGLRVYDVSTPSMPELIGSLTEGFTDAFAVEVVGRVAYVADGAGGMKLVKVENPAAMEIVAGEGPGSGASGTSEDVLAIGADIYVAAGSAGVVRYINGQLEQKVYYETPTLAKALSQVGDNFLAVADISGVVLYRVEADGQLTWQTREAGLHRMLGTNGVTLRLWHGVADWQGTHLIAANWDAVDVYQLVAADEVVQADITASVQRLRFNISGGDKTVKLVNEGTAPLLISDITGNGVSFSVQPTSGTIEPGGLLELQIHYTGGAPGEGLFKIYSNDADEAILPVKVFGQTSYLDPGESAADFTLPRWIYNHTTQSWSYDTFQLSEQAGKVVYFQVYGTWCPACLPVIADLQNSVVAEFEGHPQVVTLIMSQKESAAVLEEYWDNLYLRAPMLFDLAGNVAQFQYAQPPTGLPFSRGFIIGPEQVVVDTLFGADSAGVIKTLKKELLKIAIAGDANLDGQVNGEDYRALRLAWGACEDVEFCPADFNDDGVVDKADLVIMREHYGEQAEP